MLTTRMLHAANARSQVISVSATRSAYLIRCFYSQRACMDGGCLVIFSMRLSGWGVLPCAQRQGFRVLTGRPAESQALWLGVLVVKFSFPTRLDGWGVLPFAQRQGLRILTKTGSRAQRQGFRVLTGRPAEA